MDDELFKNLVGKIVDKGKQNDIFASRCSR